MPFQLIASFKQLCICSEIKWNLSVTCSKLPNLTQVEPVLHLILNLPEFQYFIFLSLPLSMHNISHYYLQFVICNLLEVGNFLLTCSDFFHPYFILLDLAQGMVIISVAHLSDIYLICITHLFNSAYWRTINSSHLPFISLVTIRGLLCKLYKSLTFGTLHKFNQML